MLKKIELSFVAVICSIAIVATLSGCSNRATSFALPSEQDSFSGKVFYNNKVDILFVVDN